MEKKLASMLLNAFYIDVIDMIFNEYSDTIFITLFRNMLLPEFCKYYFSSVFMSFYPNPWQIHQIGSVFFA